MYISIYVCGVLRYDTMCAMVLRYDTVCAMILRYDTVCAMVLRYDTVCAMVLEGHWSHLQVRRWKYYAEFFLNCTTRLHFCHNSADSSLIQD
jgi:hypothetical protein